MILKLEQNKNQNDIEVLIKYPEKSKTVESLVSFVNSFNTKIEGYIENSITQINVSDICYIESNDKTTVVFCEKDSYKTKYRLYQIYEKLTGLGFVQISKYCLLNINKLDKIKPLTNRRMEAVLKNGKRLFITRKYLYDIKKELQEITNEK